MIAACRVHAPAFGGGDIRRRLRPEWIGTGDYAEFAVPAVAGMEAGCGRHGSVTAAPGESDGC
jgi:hypothetical protein